MTPRGTDWGLATLVALAAATGLLMLFAGTAGRAWVYAVHGIGGFALAAVLVWKLRRIGGRLLRPRDWDRRTRAGVLAFGLVAVTLATGWLWASGIGLDLRFLGYNGLNWHWALGALLALTVLTHALIRAKRPRRADLASRRQFLLVGGVAVAATGAWWLQRPLTRVLGLEGARRRFTGSYETDSFAGNSFPTTSWVSDDPRVLDTGEWRLEVAGNVARPLTLRRDELDRGDEVTALLDCTGGFYSRQRWRGVRLTRLIADARPKRGASHVRIVSHTGYRASFSLDDVSEFLLATEVGDEPISHGHGAPLRLVAPGRRGFEWVKWVVGVELHDGPDPGALASTVWSSFTPEGRGDA